MTKYNIIDEPWLYVKMLSGELRHMSVREVLIHSEEIDEIRPPLFYGGRFYPYAYVAYRLLIAIYMDMIRDLDDPGLMRHPNEEIINAYLDKWYDRFDLFDPDHPFMQATDEDLRFFKEEGLKTESGASCLLDFNPLAIAASGRIYRAPADEHTMHELTYECVGGEKKTKVEKGTMQKLAKAIDISFDHAVYALLYQNSIYRAVGCAAFSCLAGKSGCWVINKKQNLWDTILANAPDPESDSEDNYYPDMPIWRWNNIRQGYEALEGQDQPTSFLLYGMFIPTKIIRILKAENDKIEEVICSSLYSTKVKHYKNTLSSFESVWVNDYEPHALKKANANAKESKKQSPYITLDLGDDIWTRLVAVCGEDEAAGEGTQENNIPNYVGSNGVLHNKYKDDVHIMMLYRVRERQKGNYWDTGKAETIIPAAIWNSEQKRNILHITLSYFDHAQHELEERAATIFKIEKDKDKRKDNRIIRSFKKKFMTLVEGSYGLHGEKSGFINQLAQSEDTDEALQHLLKAQIQMSKEFALQVFDNLYSASNEAGFMREKINLNRNLAFHKKNKNTEGEDS